jgi:hypothetical protein
MKNQVHIKSSNLFLKNYRLTFLATKNLQNHLLHILGFFKF